MSYVIYQSFNVIYHITFIWYITFTFCYAILHFRLRNARTLEYVGVVASVWDVMFQTGVGCRTAQSENPNVNCILDTPFLLEVTKNIAQRRRCRRCQSTWKNKNFGEQTVIEKYVSKHANVGNWSIIAGTSEALVKLWHDDNRRYW